MHTLEVSLCCVVPTNHSSQVYKVSLNFKRFIVYGDVYLFGGVDGHLLGFSGVGDEACL